MTLNATRGHTPIKVAILAMGGQGGGVLADWIVDMAEHAGWWAQTTSVPGVAQRTGATIYYLEMISEAAVAEAGKPPVLAMMPTPGDVDVVVAAELMEGGRAIQRGLVTPGRTLLITSSHRSYAIAEKAARGNGIADPDTVISAGQQAAKRFYCIDLQALADQAGSVISASLFGALSGSGALPFTRADYEATISRSGLGVDASQRAFALGFDATVQAPEAPALLQMPQVATSFPQLSGNPLTKALVEEILLFPAQAQPLLMAGTQRAAEFQDPSYASEYLTHMRAIRDLDAQFGGESRQWALTTAAARYVAVAMAYDDVIRVADLKTRLSREARVREEAGAAQGQILHTTEYMHPRLDEICGTLPASWGEAIERSPRTARVLQPLFRKGRFIRSSSLTGFLLLYGLAGMRRFRRRTLRHKREQASLSQWLKLISDTVHHDYDLAVEVVNMRRLVKGYSDTHERGSSKYQRLGLAASQLLGRPDAAIQLRALREAALADDHGDKLDSMLNGLLQERAEAPTTQGRASP